jgi:hypothetical protein
MKARASVRSSDFNPISAFDSPKHCGQGATPIVNLAALIFAASAVVSPENLPGKWLAVSPISHYKKALVVFSGLG